MLIGLGLGFANPGGTWGKWDVCLCFGCAECGWCWRGVGGWAAMTIVWEGVMSVCVVSMDYLC